MIFPDADGRCPELIYDVAIYGAGPAGISLARALAGRGHRIGLFEAGGLRPPPMGPAHPYRGKITGHPYDLEGTRLRYLGGTTNHWGGWCLPLDPYDFAPRGHIPLSGWPFSRNELEPYLRAAVDVCEVQHGGLGFEAFAYDFGYDGFLHHAVDVFRVKTLLFSPPTRFGRRYREELDQAEDIDCKLDATLAGMTTSADRIDRVLVRASTGGETRVSARFHVLAMGAIENARALLHSGIANSSGFVGRCFADHFGVTAGVALAELSNRYFKHAIRHGGAVFPIMPHLAIREDFLREHRLPNLAIVMAPRSLPDRDPLVTDVKHQLDGSTSGNTHAFRVGLRIEPTPNPESRITLTGESDGYGVPRVALNWQVNRFDLDSMERVSELLGALFGAAGARLRRDFNIDAASRSRRTWQSHQLGTTRMSADPGRGVVNGDLRCHDITNLYVSGSSVFPTYGFANPTLTLVALSLRLAEHLTQLLDKTHA